MKKIRIAFFGSPDFSARFLEKLIKNTSMNQYIEVKLVVTQPDRPVGRKQILTPTAVKETADKLKKSENVFFETIAWGPDKRGEAVEKNDVELGNIDLALVYAFSAKIPQQLLDLPKYGFWCIHPSLLPKYRGTSPMATALINGDKETGVTIIKMDEKIDHGPIIAQESLTIENTDYRPDLEKNLTDLAFELFKNTIDKLLIANYELETTKQNHKEATYTKKLTKQDGFIPFENLKIKNLELNKNLKLKIYNLYRGLYSWPGIWTILPNGKRLKITEMFLDTSHATHSTLRIKKVQLEGKKETNFETFNKAYKIFG